MVALETSLDQIQAALESAAGEAIVQVGKAENQQVPLPSAESVLAVIETSQEQLEPAWQLFFKLLSVGLSPSIITQILPALDRRTQEVGVDLFSTIRAINTPLPVDNLEAMAALQDGLLSFLQQLGVPNAVLVETMQNLIRYDLQHATNEFALLPVHSNH